MSILYGVQFLRASIRVELFYSSPLTLSLLASCHPRIERYTFLGYSYGSVCCSLADNSSPVPLMVTLNSDTGAILWLALTRCARTPVEELVFWYLFDLHTRSVETDAARVISLCVL